MCVCGSDEWFPVVPYAFVFVLIVPSDRVQSPSGLVQMLHNGHRRQTQGRHNARLGLKGNAAVSREDYSGLEHKMDSSSSSSYSRIREQRN